jgi:hypothetical protein
MNWIILVPVGIGLVALVVFLVWKNSKDEKKFRQQMNSGGIDPEKEVFDDKNKNEMQ